MDFVPKGFPYLEEVNTIIQYLTAAHIILADLEVHEYVGYGIFLLPKYVLPNQKKLSVIYLGLLRGRCKLRSLY